MISSRPQAEYVANTRIGEKGQLTIPKQYRDDLGLETGAPVAVVRMGKVLILVPEQDRFRLLCESVTAAFERRQLSATDLLDTLPEARKRVFARRYPVAGQTRGGARRRSRGR